MISNSLFFDLAGKTILFGTDFSPAANRALPNVTALARRFHCHLLVVHALSKSLAVEAEPEIPQRNDNQPGPEELQNKMRVLLASDALVGLSYEVIVRPGEVWSVVSEIVGEKGVVLVTLGTRGLGGWQKLLSGSVAEDLLRVVACPVMTIGPNVGDTPERFSRILYATDFHEASYRALPYAVALAQADEASLTLLHVIPKGTASHEPLKLPEEYRKELAVLLPMESALRQRVELTVERGVPAEQIVRKADMCSADLIVLGAHPAGRIATYLASSTHYTLQHAHCPVLTVRGDL